MKYKCPCCGLYTLKEPANGNYEICEVCFWEDDPLASEDVNSKSGANKVSLAQARKNYIEFGACTSEMKKYVRNPRKEERIKPINCNTESRNEPTMNNAAKLIKKQIAVTSSIPRDAVIANIQNTKRNISIPNSAVSSYTNVRKQLNRINQVTRVNDSIKKSIGTEIENNTSGIVKKIYEMNHSIIGAMRSPAMQAADAIRKSITKELKDIQLAIPKELMIYQKKFTYLEKLRKANWPLYLEDDESLMESILTVQLDKEDLGEEKIKEIAMNYCNDEFIDRSFENWKNSEAINKNRLPILEEAIKNYQDGRYYSSTSLLMEQMMGLIEDTFQYYDTDGENQPDVEDLTGICNYIRMSENNVLQKDRDTQTLKPKEMKKLKEKGQLVYIIGMLGARGMIYWRVSAEYISTVVLASGSHENDYAAHHPMRNKICHGEQLDYGTKEHALKAILSINLMVNIADAVKYRLDRKNLENDDLLKEVKK